MTTEQVAQLDEILNRVCGRHTVYAREVLDPLTRLLSNEDARTTFRVLQSVVGKCNGEEYLHFRDFLNPLLDLRAALKET